MTDVWQGKVVRLRAVEPDDWQAFFNWDLDTDFARWTYYGDVILGMTVEEFDELQKGAGVAE